MVIDRVSVTYGELRSTGYPSYSNRRYEVTLAAALENGESAETVKVRLLDLCKREVAKFFGDKLESANELEKPYIVFNQTR